VNTLRLEHKDTKLLTLQAAAAKWLHAEMNKAGYDFTTKLLPALAGSDYKNCQAIQYTGAVTIASTYTAGIDSYSFAKHDYKPGGKAALLAADAAKKKAADKFLQLVWKSSTSVGFAKVGKETVGLYCPKATDTVAQFATNVGAKCISATKVNTCFNAVQLAAANAKRKLHGAVPLRDDPAAGAVLQKKLTDITAATWANGELDLPA
jgi:hypothetical protein